MKHRHISFLAIAALMGAAMVLAVVTSAATAGHSAGAAGDKRKAFGLHMKFTPTGENIAPSQKPQIDAFDGDGSPFGDSTLRTASPRKYRPWERVGFIGFAKHGTYHGEAEVKKIYVETGDNEQIVRYESRNGRIYFGTERYRGITGDDIDFYGYSRCVRGSCEGRFRLTGTVKY